MSNESDLSSFVEEQLDDLYIDDLDLIWGPVIEGRANALHNIIEYVKEHYIAKD